MWKKKLKKNHLTKRRPKVIEAIAISLIEVGGMAIGGLSFGLCLGLGMYLSGVRMTIATVERNEAQSD